MKQEKPLIIQRFKDQGQILPRYLPIFSICSQTIDKTPSTAVLPFASHWKRIIPEKKTERILNSCAPFLLSYFKATRY
ncbi:MAG: hypothetical protein LBR26_14355 [Prevotella sp.]|nr:hypothetical protein [Prevotella sp.]